MSGWRVAGRRFRTLSGFGVLSKRVRVQVNEAPGVLDYTSAEDNPLNWPDAQCFRHDYDSAKTDMYPLRLEGGFARTFVDSLRVRILPSAGHGPL